MQDFSSKYTLGEEIGRGAFAQVFKCINKQTSEIKAVKIGSDKSLLNESILLEKLNHTAFPKVYDVYVQDNKIFVITDYFPGISLYQYLIRNTPLKENVALDILRRMIDALNYLHTRDIAHLDIKPENIIIDPTTLHIKVIDFGFARECASSCNSFNGSMSYTAPELYFKKTYNACLSDIWSVGVVFFTMLAGYLPFPPADKKEEHIKAVVMGERKDLQYPISENCQRIIDGCLTVDPSKRLTGYDILSIISGSSVPRCVRASSLTVCSKRNPLIARPIVRSSSTRKNIRICM